MAEDHHITIDGKKWLLRFTRLKGDASGWTYFDNAAQPRILIDERARGWSRVETILHELAHATLGPQISEEAVTELARPKATLLDEIDSAVAQIKSHKARTWFDLLPDEAKNTLLAACEKYRAGGYDIRKYALASVLIDYAVKRGWRVCNRKGIAEWLTQQS